MLCCIPVKLRQAKEDIMLQCIIPSLIPRSPVQVLTCGVAPVLNAVFNYRLACIYACMHVVVLLVGYDLVVCPTSFSPTLFTWNSPSNYGHNAVLLWFLLLHFTALLCLCLQDLPPTLLPYLRLAHCQSAEELNRHGAAITTGSMPLADDQEAQVLQNLTSCLQRRLQRLAEFELSSCIWSACKACKCKCCKI